LGEEERGRGQEGKSERNERGGRERVGKEGKVKEGEGREMYEGNRGGRKEKGKGIKRKGSGWECKGKEKGVVYLLHPTYKLQSVLLIDTSQHFILRYRLIFRPAGCQLAARGNISQCL